MDPIKPKFYQTGFEIEVAGQALQLKGLVSEQGVTKIFIPADLPPFWAKQAGQIVTVKIDSLTVKALLSQQFVENGSYFELRFQGIDDNQKNYIRQRVAADGISPGWQRKFPRIPVAGPQDPGLPVPSLCLVRFIGQEHFVSVTNFTLGGIRIETMGDVLGELRVGSMLSFDLMTNTGVVMANLSGEVRNLAVREGGAQPPIRSFGLRFVDWDLVNERKYRELIKDYCLAIQKTFTQE